MKFVVQIKPRQARRKMKGRVINKSKERFQLGISTINEKIQTRTNWTEKIERNLTIRGQRVFITKTATRATRGLWHGKVIYNDWQTVSKAFVFLARHPIFVRMTDPLLR